MKEPNEWLRSLALRAGRVRFVTARVEGATPSPGTLLVSVHACGGLTDLLLRMAVDSSAPVAVVPCCHQRDDAWNEVLGGSEVGNGERKGVDSLRLDSRRSIASAFAPVDEDRLRLSAIALFTRSFF